MKEDELFRRIALALPDVEEKSHFGKPDFRVCNKIFAGFSDKGRAYVKLSPEQQEMLTATEPHLVAAHQGHWGRQGWTWIDHSAADKALLESVLLMAWKTVAPKTVLKQNFPASLS